MKVRLAPRAVREAKRRKSWWVSNRPSAATLFDRELDSAIALLERTPNVGVVYQIDAQGRSILRLLLRRTGTHVYYVIGADDVTVISLWGARKARGPSLAKNPRMR